MDLDRCPASDLSESGLAPLVVGQKDQVENTHPQTDSKGLANPFSESNFRSDRSSIIENGSEHLPSQPIYARQSNSLKIDDNGEQTVSNESMFVSLDQELANSEQTVSKKEIPLNSSPETVSKSSCDLQTEDPLLTVSKGLADSSASFAHSTLGPAPSLHHPATNHNMNPREAGTVSETGVAIGSTQVPSENRRPEDKSTVEASQGRRQSPPSVMTEPSRRESPKASRPFADSVHQLSVTLSVTEPIPESFFHQETKKINSEQTDSKHSSNGEQTGSHSVANGQQTGSKGTANTLATESKRLAKRVAIGEQNSQPNLEPSLSSHGDPTFRHGSDKPQELERTSGLERRFIEYIFSKCKEMGSLETGPITAREIARALGFENDQELSTKNHVKNVIYRVITEKKLVERTESKTGRSGWAKFKIEQLMYRHLMDQERVSEQLAKHSFSPPIYLSTMKEKNINNEIGTQTASPLLTNSLKPADPYPNISLSRVRSFGIHEKHLFDIRKNKWEIEESDLQEMINRYPAYLSSPEGKQIAPDQWPRVFLSLVKSKAKDGVSLLDYVLTPEELDLDRQLQAAKRQKEEVEAKRQELIALKFELWRLDQSPETLRALVPPVIDSGSEIFERTLKAYFAKEIYR